MSHYYSSAEIEEIISFNKALVTKRNEIFGVKRDVLYGIFSRVNSYLNTTEDKRTTIIIKTSIVIGGITWSQPFSEGNKETAVAVGILFLKRNGYNLPFENNKDSLYDLLQKTMWKFEDDKSIYMEIEEYLNTRIIVAK